MGKLRFLLTLWMAKLSIPALKITRHNGTDFPGSLAVKLCPDFLKYIGKPAHIVAVTGTNGKTTTTSLTYDIMKRHAKKALLVGNIEIPYTGYALESDKDSVTVAEISSFQLETMVTFKPHVTAILNITPDHLDRHKTLENYIAIKESITKNQDENDFCVLNYNDPVLREFGKTPRCKVIFFSSSVILLTPFRNFELESDTGFPVSAVLKLTFSPIPVYSYNSRDAVTR